MTERRFLKGLTVKRSADGGPSTITGCAVVYNSRSELLWPGFYEVIEPGALRKALIDPNLDVRALNNHDPNQVLGRSKNNTLTMADGDNGLSVIIQPPDTQAARDLLTLIERGDVDGMSFAFTVDDFAWSETMVEGYRLRTVRSINTISDVSVVTYPAYPATSAEVRSLYGDAPTLPVPAPSMVPLSIRRREMQLRELTAKRLAR